MNFGGYNSVHSIWHDCIYITFQKYKITEMERRLVVARVRDGEGLGVAKRGIVKIFVVMEECCLLKSQVLTGICTCLKTTYDCIHTLYQYHFPHFAVMYSYIRHNQLETLGEGSEGRHCNIL
jgi:hypothetical protein